MPRIRSFSDLDEAARSQRRYVTADGLSWAVKGFSQCGDADFLFLDLPKDANSRGSQRGKAFFERDDFLGFEKFTAIKLFGSFQGAFPKALKSNGVNRYLFHSRPFFRNAPTSLKKRSTSFS